MGESRERPWTRFTTQFTEDTEGWQGLHNRISTLTRYTACVKRWTCRILICLILGAVTTVCVAWGLAIVRPANLALGRSERIRFAPCAPHWEVDVIEHRGALMIFSRAAEGWLRSDATNDSPPWSIASTPPSQSICRERREVLEVAYGWPMRAMFIREWSTSMGLPDRVEYGLQVAQSYGVTSGGYLPLRPTGPSFILNSLFFAIAWFAPLWVMGKAYQSIHHAHRRRRGRCPQCAYDLRGEFTSGCTECGWNRMREGTTTSEQRIANN